MSGQITTVTKINAYQKNIVKKSSLNDVNPYIKALGQEGAGVTLALVIV